MKGFRRPAGGEIHEFGELDIDGQASPMRQEIVRGPVAPHEGLWIFGFSLWVSQCLPMGNNGLSKRRGVDIRSLCLVAQLHGGRDALFGWMAERVADDPFARGRGASQPPGAQGKGEFQVILGDVTNMICHTAAHI